MASSTAGRIPDTVEAYKKLAQRDLELIMEQREVINNQSQKINQLRQKLKAMKHER